MIEWKWKQNEIYVIFKLTYKFNALLTSFTEKMAVCDCKINVNTFPLMWRSLPVFVPFFGEVLLQEKRAWLGKWWINSVWVRYRYEEKYPLYLIIVVSLLLTLSCMMLAWATKLHKTCYCAVWFCVQTREAFLYTSSLFPDTRVPTKQPPVTS